jgi:nicotinate-nucleotide--dimethylbenzimidazole phosphoribosyltransferase
VTGQGTGLDEAGIERKTRIVEAALERHGALGGDPIGVLGSLGWLEIAALVGAILAAAEGQVPIVLDGFITGAAALVAAAIAPRCAPRLIASHRSSEPGHRTVLEALGLRPLLELDLRLGEASGAALALPILAASTALLREMATFGEAGVSAE